MNNAMETVINQTLKNEELLAKHNGWDNFYYERPVIKKICHILIRRVIFLLIDRQKNLIEAILICRIGNGVSYNSGVSPGARPYYDKFLEMLNNNQLELLLKELKKHSYR
ncbi:hypothetical protein ACDX78_04645 [Virgibacillus oceani]